MAIIGLLGAIVAVVAPKFAQTSRVAEGSRQFTSWLALARQRALKDRAPRGLRFVDVLPTSVTRTQDFYYKFGFIEQPEDIAIQPVEIARVPANQLASQRQAYQTAAAQRPDLAPAIAGLINPQPNNRNPNGWRFLVSIPGRNLTGGVVQTGDVLEMAGARYAIACEPFGFPTGNDTLMVLTRPRDEARTGLAEIQTLPLPSARITRRARPIAGEPDLTLPTGVAVDILWTNIASGQTATRSLPAPDQNSTPGSQFFDILFAPSGEVMGAAGTNGRLVFWLRDVSLRDSGPGTIPEGENRLVVLHCRTGQITVHAVNPDPTDPYRFVRDGKSSALED
jgi:hypothetical protein